MTYDLEAVKAAVLAVAPDVSIFVGPFPYGEHIVIETASNDQISFWTDGDFYLDIMVTKHERPIVRAIIDDLDRQDAAREGAQT